MISNMVCFHGEESFLDLIKDKSFHFFLVSTYTDTASIKGITSAGLPGLVHYTPALDMELLYYGYPKSLTDIPEMPEGPPTPVLITSSVRSLTSFPLTFLDLGLRVEAKAPFVKINSSFSKSILEGASVLARELYLEGKLFARELLKSSSPYVFVLGECVPAGTSTAYAVSRALGYLSADRAFSSSSPSKETYDLKTSIVEEAFDRFGGKIKDVFDAIHYLGDNMQAFLSGMAIEISKVKKVILAGGSQMAAIYGILQKIDEEVAFSNIALMTTKWIAQDKYSDIKSFLAEINPSLNAFYADFSFEGSLHKMLKLYDEGYVKEGALSGAALSYAYIRGLSSEEIRAEIDKMYSKFIS